MKRLFLTAAAAGLLAGSSPFAFAAGAPGSTPMPPASGSTQPAATPHQHAARADADSHQSQRMTRALNTLEANGYGDFSNFQPSGKDFTATVLKDGRQVSVVIDPDTGQVRPAA